MRHQEWKREVEMRTELASRVFKPRGRSLASSLFVWV